MLRSFATTCCFVKRYDIDPFEKFGQIEKILCELLQAVPGPLDEVYCLPGKYNRISAGYNLDR